MLINNLYHCNQINHYYIITVIIIVMSMTECDSRNVTQHIKRKKLQWNISF